MNDESLLLDNFPVKVNLCLDLELSEDFLVLFV